MERNDLGEVVRAAVGDARETLRERGILFDTTLSWWVVEAQSAESASADASVLQSNWTGAWDDLLRHSSVSSLNSLVTNNPEDRVAQAVIWIALHGVPHAEQEDAIERAARLLRRHQVREADGADSAPMEWVTPLDGIEMTSEEIQVCPGVDLTACSPFLLRHFQGVGGSVATVMPFGGVAVSFAGTALRVRDPHRHGWSNERDVVEAVIAFLHVQHECSICAGPTHHEDLTAMGRVTGARHPPFRATEFKMTAGFVPRTTVSCETFDGFKAFRAWCRTKSNSLGVHWFARGCHEYGDADRLLAHMIALEALVLNDIQHGELRFRLASRLAWLLGTSVTERRDLARTAGHLYDIRSHLVHNGTMDSKTKWAKDWKRLATPGAAAKQVQQLTRRVIQALVDRGSVDWTQLTMGGLSSADGRSEEGQPAD